MNQKKSWYADYVYQAENPFAGVAPEVIELLRKELAEGEEILWFEQPRAFNLWRGWQTFFSFGAIGINLFNIFLNLILFPIMTGRETSFWPLWLFLGILWVLAIAIIPIIYRRTVHKMLYVLTTQRAIIISGKSVKSYYLHQQIHASTVIAKAKKNGNGDLIFAEETVAKDSQIKIKFLGIRQ